MTDSDHSIQATAEQTRTYLRNQAVRQTWPRLDECADVIDALLEQLEAASRQIRAEHAQKAAIGGGPCVCEWCASNPAKRRTVTTVTPRYSSMQTPNEEA